MPQSTQPQHHSSLGSKLLKFGIPLIVSVGLCIALFRGVDIPEMMRIIRDECDFRYIGACMIIGIIPIIARAARWGLQLDAIGVKPPFHILFYSIFGTYAFNIVFPRLGEVWRSGYIAYRQEAPFSEVFGSMIADRMADTITVGLITLFTFIVASGPFVDFISTYPEAYNKIQAFLTSPWTWIGCAAFCIALWLLLKYGKSKPVVKLRSFLKGIWDGFIAIARMNHKGKWLLLTAIIWGCYFSQMYVAFYAFPMTRELLSQHGVMVVLICYTLSTIAMGIPSNGGIGPYQTAVLFGLEIFAPPAVALAVNPAAHKAFVTAGAAFGNTLLGAQTLTFIVGGIIVFILIAIDRRNITRKKA